MQAEIFYQPVAEDFTRVDQVIHQQLKSDVALVESIGQYIVEAGGKRLRPLLVLLSAKSCGYQGQQHSQLAALIEFLHTATLLHDDVVDTSELRRGKATANAKFGNAPSVLVGDFLYSKAFQMMVELGDLGIMNVLSKATTLIAEGEVLQLMNARNPNTNEAQYLEVITGKTAKLFEASCQSAALLSKCSESQAIALSNYGLHLGLAFQIMDDMLDYQGDAQLMGKNVGDDLAEGKPTLPLIETLKRVPTDQQELIRQAIRNASAEQAEEIIQLVKGCGALDYCQTQADAQAQQAKQQLDALTDSNYRQTLAALADFAVQRAS